MIWIPLSGCAGCDDGVNADAGGGDGGCSAFGFSCNWFLILDCKPGDGFDFVAKLLRQSSACRELENVVLRRKIDTYVDRGINPCG